MPFDSLIYDFFYHLIPYCDIKDAFTLTQVNKKLHKTLWNEQYAAQVMKIHARYSSEYATACQKKGTFQKALVIFVGSSDRIRQANPSSILRIPQPELSSQVSCYKLGQGAFCYNTQDLQSGRTVLYHINIAQMTTTVRDLSDETMTKEPYEIKEILFCSLESIILYSVRDEKKKLRIFALQNGQLRRSGNLAIPRGEDHPTVLLDGEYLLVCTYNEQGWNIRVWNLPTQTLRVSKHEIGLAECRPQNMGRHFCFGVFHGNFYLMHTRQPSDIPLVERVLEIRPSENGIVGRSEGWGPVSPDTTEIGEGGFYNVGSVPITFATDIQWETIQRWRVQEYNHGTTLQDESTDLWLEGRPTDGHVLIIESRLEATSSGRKRVFFQQPIAGSRIKSEVERCRKGASYTYVPRAATFLEVLNSGMGSLTLQSSMSSRTICEGEINSEYAIVESNTRSLVLKGRDASFILVSFDPTIAVAP